MNPSQEYPKDQVDAMINWNWIISIWKMLDVFAKRLLDIVASFFGLLFLMPVFVVIALLIKRDTPGPILYRGERLGKNCRVFKMLKFRTMYETSASYAGARVTAKGDERITPFGAWLRDTKINELPQLWNVLKGEMSIVGPRPEDVLVGNNWDEDDRKEILSVKPGITSPASILYHDEETLLNQNNLMESYFKDILPDKIRLDRLYVRNRTFGADLDIIFWTLVIIIPRMVKEKIPEGYFFSGPFTRLLNRYATWFLIDFATSLAAMSLANGLWVMQNPTNVGIQYLAVFSLVLTVIFSVLSFIFGLHRVEWSSSTINDAIVLVFSCWATIFILWLFNSTLPSRLWFTMDPLPLGVILIIGFLMQIGLMSTRRSGKIIPAIANIWLNWRRNAMDIGEKVLIVGAGDNFNTANWLLKRKEFQYVFKIVGLVDDNIPSKHGMLLNGCMVLGSTSDIPRIVKKENIGVIVFTTVNIPREIKEYAENLRSNSFVRLVFVDNLASVISQQLTVPVVRPAYPSWSEDYVKYLSMHDKTTGLPNHILFQDHLRHAIAVARRHHYQPQVLFVDLNFSKEQAPVEQKVWNEIIRKATERLQKLRRESDTLTYLGIHGFAFIFENDPSETAIQIIGDRIINALTQPYGLDGQTFHPSVTLYLCADFGTDDRLKESSKDGKLLDYALTHRKIIRTVDA